MKVIYFTLSEPIIPAHCLTLVIWKQTYLIFIVPDPVNILTKLENYQIGMDDEPADLLNHENTQKGLVETRLLYILDRGHLAPILHSFILKKVFNTGFVPRH